MQVISGKELQVGDTIEVWWAPRRDTIVSFRKHSAPAEWYASLHGSPIEPGSVRIAEFALLKGGMTVFPADQYELIARAGVVP